MCLCGWVWYVCVAGFVDVWVGVGGCACEMSVLVSGLHNAKRLDCKLDSILNHPHHPALYLRPHLMSLDVLPHPLPLPLML